MASSGSRNLKTTFTGDAKGYSKAVDDVTKKTDGIGKKMGSMAKVAGGALAVGFATDKIVDFGAELIGLGTQSENWRNKAATVFESSTDSMAKWADESAGALGLTGDNLLGLSANFADLLKPMGFTADQAAEMSKETLDLSGALSAWSGGTRSAAEVSEILSKAMLGEREQLKGLGISITENDVKTRLAAKGQAELTGEALQQAKAIATQELIMEKSTDAQAAWSDGTQDNIKAQAELSAKFAEVKETLGEKLLPVFQAVVGWVADTAIPAVEELVDIFSADGLGGVLSHVGDSFKKAWPAIQQTLADVGAGLWEWIQESGPEVLRAIGRVWWSLERWLFTTALPAIAKAMGEMAVALWEWIQEAAPPALRELGRLLGQLWEWIRDVGLPKLAAAAADLGAALWEWIKDVTPPALKALGELVLALFDWIIDDGLPMLLDAAVELTKALWEWIKDVAPLALRALGRLLADIGTWIIGTALPALVRQVARWAAALVDWVADAVTAIPGKLARLLATIGTWIAGAAYTIVVKAVELRNAMLGWVSDAVRTMPSRLWDLGNVILGWVRSLPGRIASAATGMFNSFITAIQAAVRGIVTAWNSIDLSVGPWTVPSWVPGFGGRTFHIKDVVPDVGVPFQYTYGPPVRRSGQNVRFHSGGTYHAPIPGGEGLALLRDGEHIRPAGDGRNAGIGDTIQVVIGTDVILQALITEEHRRGPLPIRVVAR